MRRLSIILGFWFGINALFGQSPHGKSLEIDCSYCHTTSGWKVDARRMTFNHDSTAFNLVGQHRTVSCRSCHKSLEFNKASGECMDCHDDLHEGTLGPDCAQCHTPQTWIVQNISDIHRRSRFPLTGAHQLTDCSACHKSASARRFDPLGTECADCHRNTYLSTTNPNHQADGFSTDCQDCHTTNPGWKPARFAEHDAKYFPVNSGNHANTWNSCSDCHKQVNNYAVFTCIDCHEHSREEMDDEHKDENDYRYNSIDCLSCHPRGN